MRLAGWQAGRLAGWQGSQEPRLKTQDWRRFVGASGVSCDRSPLSLCRPYLTLP